MDPREQIIWKANIAEITAPIDNYTEADNEPEKQKTMQTRELKIMPANVQAFSRKEHQFSVPRHMVDCTSVAAPESLESAVYLDSQGRRITMPMQRGIDRTRSMTRRKKYKVEGLRGGVFLWCGVV